ncbi:hypothetical protein EJB05_31628 [Eragrostis curvula]|uniref:M-phase phosphoprotein 6 n=1 Tax=Eragrostis curvula TaxID=38414 RepID=A0A5J9UF59_9POAL|nr:hypothetical protein EJB05_31628 [Eragrostis curvula]
MSAKRELSSTLKNLKFMQRATAAQKVQEKTEVEVETAAEVVTATSGGFGSSAQVARKCIVIMEGNPHPGAVKGRMSFQNFNPEIDKLNGDARGDNQSESASPSSCHQDGAKSGRGDGVPASRFGDLDTSESISLNELKRKQPDLEMETPPSHKLPKTTGRNVNGGSSLRSNGRGSQKSNKREKYDFNHLRR